jgi:hypothetical protein
VIMFEVTTRLDNVHPNHPKYPLLPGDALTQQNGAWTKEAPGLMIHGFVLNDQQTTTLRARKVERRGLNYYPEGRPTMAFVLIHPFSATNSTRYHRVIDFDDWCKNPDSYNFEAYESYLAARDRADLLNDGEYLDTWLRPEREEE